MGEQVIERLMIFIDGSNLFHCLKSYDPNYRPDFEKLIKHLSEGYNLLRTFYYNAKPEHFSDSHEDRRKYAKQMSFYDALEYIPSFKVRLSRLKSRQTFCRDCKKYFNNWVEKGLDVSLATDLLNMAFKDAFDKAILISGDSDFVQVVESVDRIGKQIINVFLDCVGKSDELAKTCFEFIKMEDFLDEIKR